MVLAAASCSTSCVARDTSIKNILIYMLSDFCNVTLMVT